MTRATHCDACFSGDYPLERTDEANGKYALEDGPEQDGQDTPPLPLVRA